MRLFDKANNLSKFPVSSNKDSRLLPKDSCLLPKDSRLLSKDSCLVCFGGKGLPFFSNRIESAGSLGSPHDDVSAWCQPHFLSKMSAETQNPMNQLDAVFDKQGCPAVVALLTVWTVPLHGYAGFGLPFPLV